MRQVFFALLPLPYRNLAGNLQQQIEKAINEQSQAIQVFETVLMRRKWLSELYAFAVNNTEKNTENIQSLTENVDRENQFSAWLTGWRREWIMTKIIPILQNATAHPSLSESIIQADATKEISLGIYFIEGT